MFKEILYVLGGASLKESLGPTRVIFFSYKIINRFLVHHENRLLSKTFLEQNFVMRREICS